MIENTNNNTIEMKSDVIDHKNEILQKADRMLSVIKNINRQGGITTQLQMAAACIELQCFDWYLKDTYFEKVIDINDFPDLPKLEAYIRLFKDIEQDFWDDLYGGHHNTKQREEDIKIISYLEEEIINNEHLRQYEEDYLHSWIELKTDIDMLSGILNYLLRIVVSELEGTYQEIRKQEEEAKHNATSQKMREPKNNIREYIKDKERTEEIIGKIHRLIGNKKNTAAINIIKEAMWIGWIERPTASSIIQEFSDNITCSESYIIRLLKEAKPTRNGKIDEEKLDKIRKKFENA